MSFEWWLLFIAAFGAGYSLAAWVSNRRTR